MADLMAIFDKMEMPGPLAYWLSTGLGNTSTAMFLDMVVRKDYETELKEMILSKFAVSETFPADTQRFYVTKARGAYRVAIEKEQEIKEMEVEQKKNIAAPEGDLERELDQNTRAILKDAWDAARPWTPDKSMKAAPAFRNRAFREFRHKCMSLHLVEKALTVEDVKRPQERKRLSWASTEDADVHWNPRSK